MPDLNQIPDWLLRVGVVSLATLLGGLVAVLLQRRRVPGWKYVPLVFLLVGYLVSEPLIAAHTANSPEDACQMLAARADDFTKGRAGNRLNPEVVFNKVTVDCTSRTYTFDTSTKVPRVQITLLASAVEQSMSKSICSVPEVVTFNHAGGKLIVRYNVSDGPPVDLTLAC